MKILSLTQRLDFKTLQNSKCMFQISILKIHYVLMCFKGTALIDTANMMLTLSDLINGSSNLKPPPMCNLRGIITGLWRWVWRYYYRLSGMTSSLIDNNAEVTSRKYENDIRNMQIIHQNDTYQSK